MPLTALLIGSNSLTVECGNRWLERGHSLAAVVTREAKVAAWAAERSLRIVAPGPGLANRLAGTDVDWVLSVANLSLVPDAVLALAGQGGVNFHDGPLPGYAGLNAPVWAILNGEPTHAVTWHLLTAGIDDGDVLACRDFPVEPDDTAFTLNTRCFAAGLDSFADVMSALEAGGHPRQPQPVGPRRMWRRADRPWAAGRLDFGKPAAEVARTVRALDHSGYRNPIAVPKIDVSGTVFAVSGAEAVTGSGTAGDVLGATDDTLTVACAEGAVRLTGLRRMDGAMVDPSTLQVGRLESPDAAEAACISAALAPVAEGEARLRGRLLTPDPVTFGTVSDAAADWQSVPLPDEPMARLALAALRALGRGRGDLAYSDGKDPAPGYVLPWVPVRIDASGATKDAEALAEQA
ncbi:MAG TPA: formyltransferase family protein, partial [Tabrizicola sp.]|nr:formyltransferase family protein [Tabrizicola sp.]